jgi:hypothetical protein
MDGSKNVFEKRNESFMTGLDSGSRKNKKEKEEVELRRDKHE